MGAVRWVRGLGREGIRGGKAEEDGFRLELDVEGPANAFADIARQRHQLLGRPATVVDEGQCVGGRNSHGPAPMALRKAGLLDQPGRGHLELSASDWKEGHALRSGQGAESPYTLIEGGQRFGAQHRVDEEGADAAAVWITLIDDHRLGPPQLENGSANLFQRRCRTLDSERTPQLAVLDLRLCSSLQAECHGENEIATGKLSKGARSITEAAGLGTDHSLFQSRQIEDADTLAVSYQGERGNRDVRYAFHPKGLRLSVSVHGPQLKIPMQWEIDYRRVE